MTEPIIMIFSMVRILVILYAIFYLPGFAFFSLVFNDSQLSDLPKKIIIVISGMAISSLIGTGFLLVIGEVNPLFFYLTLQTSTVLCWFGVIWKNNRILNFTQTKKANPTKNSQIIFGIFIMLIGSYFAVNSTATVYPLEDLFSKNIEMTEFYVAPSFFNSNLGYVEENLIPVEIENHADTAKKYLIIVSQQGTIITVIPNLTVAPSGHIREIIEIPYSELSKDFPIDIYLYDHSQTEIKNSLRLWIEK